MNVFVRLGGFHQLMSFLGSIEKVMEGSGLRSDLETVYSPGTVGHIFTGKAYSRAVGGHILCASAVQSITLEEFWSTLGAVDQLELQKYYESDDPSTFANEELAITLTTWMETKCKELSKSSRTSAFWLNYVKYVYLVQEFIHAERESTGLEFVCIGRKINAKPFCSYWVKQLCKILSIVLAINFGSGNQPPRSILSVYIRSTNSEKDGEKMDGDLDGFIN